MPLFERRTDGRRRPDIHNARIRFQWRHLAVCFSGWRDETADRVHLTVSAKETMNGWAPVPGARAATFRFSRRLRTLRRS